MRQAVNATPFPDSALKPYAPSALAAMPSAFAFALPLTWRFPLTLLVVVDFLPSNRLICEAVANFMAEFDLDDSGGLEFDEYVQLVAAVQVYVWQ